MTGYGQIASEIDQINYAVEIRTVNNRYFKANMRIPEIASFAEDKVEKLLKENFSRGMINYTLKIKNLAPEDMVKIDNALLSSYIKQLKEIAADDETISQINLADLITLPGVVTAAEPDEQHAQKLQDAISKVTTEAIEKVKQMRGEEGKALLEDMQNHCQIIEEKLGIIESLMDSLIDKYHEKLEKRVDQLLKKAQLDIDQEMLAREVAIFAERSDISEEISRLKSHIAQFTQTCESNGGAGKKLDFIAQEMLREANTIASKASDPNIAQCVVDIKCCIDRIKEQVQNVE